MKTCKIVCVCLCFVLAGAVQAELNLSDLGVAAQYSLPGMGDSDLYDWGIGTEVQYRYWLSDNFGWALGVGWAKWETSSSSSQWGAPVDGWMQMIPAGGSLLYRTPNEPVRLVLEGGVRYAVIGEDMSLIVNGEKESVSLDDGVFAVLGIDLERDVSFGQVFVGVTFQFDLMAPSASWSGGELRDADLAAATFRAGLRRKF